MNQEIISVLVSKRKELDNSCKDIIYTEMQQRGKYNPVHLTERVVSVFDSKVTTINKISLSENDKLILELKDIGFSVELERQSCDLLQLIKAIHISIEEERIKKLYV